MCNLYNVKSSREEMAATFRAKAHARKNIRVEKTYVSPAKPGFIVREQEGVRVLDEMLWGFPLPDGKLVTNVRNYTSPFWRSTLQHPTWRCLVPATAFQEWSEKPLPETGKKRAYWFSVPCQPIFAFAGIWRPIENGAVFSFLTCGYHGDPSTHAVGAIHPKACPVVLHEEDYDRWLHADLDDALTLAAPFPSQLMTVGAVPEET